MKSLIHFPSVWADESRLRQVLLNLYSNATKYTDQGEINLTIKEVDGEVCFSLKDTGIGIPEEQHNRIFEEFQQAKESGRDPRSGTGLGLAISSQLLNLMNGRIWMESKLGEGSTFHFAVQRYHNQDQAITSSEQATDASVQPETDTTQTTSSDKKLVEPEVS